MDGVNQSDSYGLAWMPPKSPLPMVQQDFSVRPVPRRAAPIDRWEWLWRAAAFGPALALTISLVVGIADWFGSGGVSVVEGAVILLVAATFIWVSLSVSTALLGLVRRVLVKGKKPLVDASAPPQNVALLYPVYNEATAEVFGNALAMLKDLARLKDRNTYALYILSDTRDPKLAALEERAFSQLRTACPNGVSVYYRRRIENTDRKVGNLNDWITQWGGAHDAMLVLDADSLMSGDAIARLTTELANDPDAGLIQSFPMLIGSETLFGRMQQFSNAVYGWLLAEGLASWSLREGNYWGHNAIIRTRAFAESAGLPYLQGRGGRQDLILSHDFVEAGLLRRAGWTVRFLPHDDGSYEESPQTLIDYALRDRRWCQGNMQHLRLLSARGFHPISRFYLLQGAFGFLMSPAWLLLIILWPLMGTMEMESQPYFSAANPLFPVWPEVAMINPWIFLAFIYSMLLLPKILGTVALSMRKGMAARYGGSHRLFGAAVFEILCSILYAPILMVQQAIAVTFAALGRSRSWNPQSRGTLGYSWPATLRFHIPETLLGILLSIALLSGAASLWLVPIAFSLICAVPLSKLSGWRIDGLRHATLRMDSPQDLKVPYIVSLAKIERARFRAELTEKPVAIAAE